MSNHKKRGWNGYVRVHPMLSALAAASFVVSVFIIVWLVRFGNTPEVYTDTVLEELGSEFANKSAELTLYRLGTALGLGIIIVCLYVIPRAAAPADKKHDAFETAAWPPAVLLVMIGGRYLFYGDISATEILAFGIAAFAYIFRGRRRRRRVVRTARNLSNTKGLVK